MKTICIALSLSCIVGNLRAQIASEKVMPRSVCATDGNVQDVLVEINYTRSLLQPNTSTNNCYYINIFFHIVRNTNRTGGQNIQVLSVIMNNLANVFSSQNVAFVNIGNDEVRNDVYMTDFSEAKYSRLISQNVRSNALNVYLLDDYTYNSGKANGIPGTALVIGGSYLTPEGVTEFLVPSLVPTHEVGHCLGLYHTFETFNGFELVDGSNCTTAGDLICDTNASDSRYNFKENTQCAWTVNFTDLNGQPFNPDPHNIMAYVRPSCMQSFTNGQGNR